VLLNVHRVNLLVQVLEGGDHGLRNALQYDLVDVVNIRFPNRRLFIDVDLSMHLSYQLMDLISVVFHVLHFLGKHTLLLSVEILDCHGSVLTFENFDVDVVQTLFDFTDGLFHDLHHFESAVDVLFSLFDEICDFLRLPLKTVQCRGQSCIHFLDSIFNQWLLHRV